AESYHFDIAFNLMSSWSALFSARNSLLMLHIANSVDGSDNYSFYLWVKKKLNKINEETSISEKTSTNKGVFTNEGAYINVKAPTNEGASINEKESTNEE
ncbi:21303_t:CDS:2, partial [Gigaspora rosea]